MAVLLNVTEVYKAWSEEEVNELIVEAKNDGGSELISHGATYKEKKPTKNNPDGEQYWVVKLKKEMYKENEI